MKLYAIGNCFVWGCLIRLFLGGTLVTVENDSSNIICKDRHFMVRWEYEDRVILIDFFRSFYFIPRPCHDLCYIGYFRRQVFHKVLAKNSTK